MQDTAAIKLLSGVLAGDEERRADRLALLGAILARPTTTLDPQTLERIGGLGRERTARAARALRRCGALEWDQTARADHIPAAARGPLTALALLSRPVGAPELVRAQARLFALADGLDEQELVLRGLLDILRADRLELETAGDGEATLAERIARAERLGVHVDDAEQALAAFAAHGAHPLLEAGIRELADLVSGARSLMERLTEEGRDRLPRRRGLAPHTLRARARTLSLGELARALGPLGRAPRVVGIGGEQVLAGRLVALQDRRRARPPEPGAELTRTPPRPPRPDALALLLGRLRAGAPAELSGVLAGVSGWQEAVVLHAGFARLHDRLRAAGMAGVRVSGELVTDPGPGVARASRAWADDWKEVR